MTGFKSPLARKSAVALTFIGGALGGLLSSARSAQAQQSYDNCVSGNCMADVTANKIAEQSRVEALSAQWCAGHPQAYSCTVDPAKYDPNLDPDLHPNLKVSKGQGQSELSVIDPSESSRLAGRIYTATTGVINKELKAKGVGAAKLLIQNPEGSPILMGFILKELHEGNLIVAARAMGDALSDASNYIDGGMKGAMPTAISPQDMRIAVSGAQKDMKDNPQYSSELKLLSDISANKSIGNFSSIAGTFIVHTISKGGVQLSLVSHAPPPR